MRYLDKLAGIIDWTNEYMGRALAWLVLFTVIVCAVVALMRYGLAVGWVWMQDIYLWANAFVFMGGVGYTLLHDKHVRVDFFYGSRSLRYKALVNIIGSLVFLIPTGVVTLMYVIPYVTQSWARWEGAGQAGGMPAVYLLKTVMIVFCVTLVAQGISLIIRSVQALTGHPGAARFYTGVEDD